MANKSALTPDQWEQVKQASIAGVDDDSICAEYQIAPGTLRCRRKRGAWPTTSTLQHKAREAVKIANAADSAQRNATNATRAPKSSVALALDATKEGTIVSFVEVNRRMRAAVQQWAVPVPETLKEGEIAIRILERTARLETPGNGHGVAVQVNIGSSVRSPANVRVIDCGEAQEEPDDEGDESQ